MTFHTAVDLPPARFTIGSVRVTKLAVGGMDNNAYLLSGSQGTILIDAAAEPERILDLIGDETLSMVVTTHAHADHYGALAPIVTATGAQPIAGAGDAEVIERETGVHSNEVWSGDIINLGNIELQVFGLVGHTPGSIALLVPAEREPMHVFTGDSLFPGGVGKTYSKADFTSLFSDVKEYMFAFPDDTVVHPGHGDATTIGAERGSLKEWRKRGW